MNKAKIAEIFYSVQGEGLYLGTPQIFVRFYGCNLQCRYCDTRPARYKEYSPGGLAVRVRRLLKQHAARQVSLTGGEPLLQADSIYMFLKKAGLKKILIYLETNGILYQELSRISEAIDIVAMDIKLPSAGGTPELWKAHERFLKASAKKNIFVKSVITASTIAADLTKAARLIGAIDRRIPFILQPNHAEMSPALMKKLFMFQKRAGRELADVRIIPQLHTMMGVR
jgi:organic radical activating enzyme